MNDQAAGIVVLGVATLLNVMLAQALRGC